MSAKITLRPEVRWTTAEHVPVVECNIATPDWVQITVNVMGGHRDSLAAAHRFAKLLNAAGIVLPVAGCSPMNQRACQYKRKDGSCRTFFCRGCRTSRPWCQGSSETTKCDGCWCKEQDSSTPAPPAVERQSGSMFFCRKCETAWGPAEPPQTCPQCNRAAPYYPPYQHGERRTVAGELPECPHGISKTFMCSRCDVAKNPSVVSPEPAATCTCTSETGRSIPPICPVCNLPRDADTAQKLATGEIPTNLVEERQAAPVSTWGLKPCQQNLEDVVERMGFATYAGSDGWKLIDAGRLDIRAALARQAEAHAREAQLTVARLIEDLAKKADCLVARLDTKKQDSK